MTLTTNGTPRAILQDLLQCNDRKECELVRTRARQHAGSGHAANAALRRLQERGLIVCEYRLTPAGKQALGAKA